MIEAWKQWEGHTVDGRFPLLQCLAGGESAGVFLTEYGVPEPRRAAIKLIRADPESVERQLARWRSVAALSHPNLLSLYERGTWRAEDATLLYVVTEYADEDLSQGLTYRALTSTEVDQTLKPVLAALSYLHSNGYAHTHLKPANILATGDEVRLSIDGVGKIGEAAGSPTPSIYEAPELAQTGVSPAADVWAVGAILVECFTQNPPLREGLESGEPIEPGPLPEPFSEIARHCLQKDPSRRWTLSDIESHLRRAPGSPQQPAPSRPPAKGLASRYLWAAAVLGLVILAFFAASRLADQSPVTDETAVIDPAPVTGAPAPSAAESETEPRPPAAAASPETRSEQPSAARRIDPPITPKPTPLTAARETAPPGGELVLGEVVRQVLPDVPAKARNTINGQVRVQVEVRVNPSGQVEGAELDSPGPSPYFARLALQAARRWEFTPAKFDGEAVASRWLIRFVFRRSGTDVRPQVLAAPSG